MTGSLLGIALASAAYVAVVAILGLLARRRSSSSPEEYFLAGRGFGTAILFMALFGTNTTSFVLVGIPGVAYEHGVGVFGLNAPIVALGIPLTFWAIGAPARRLARDLGALTPAELYARRLGSRAVGVLLFAAFTVYTIPYMVQGVKASTLVLSQATAGRAPAWAIGLAILAVTVLYTWLGGMRATAWTNAFQGALFLAYLAAAFFLMSSSLGGLEEAMRRAAAEATGLLVLDGTWLYEPRAWASWALVISLAPIAFPHMLVRLMAAAGDRALRGVSLLYPLALTALWLPAVLIGVWGRGAFPHLSNPDEVFQAMAGAHLPRALGALAFLAVLGAVMSTLDAQLLTLSSMLLRDVLEPLRGRLAAGVEVRVGRAFTLGVAAATWVLSLTWGRSIFEISRFAFEGYATLVPALLLGVRWRRFTARGAVASILAGNAVLAAGSLWKGMPTLGFLPVFWAFWAALAAGVAASLAGPRGERRAGPPGGPAPTG